LKPGVILQTYKKKWPGYIEFIKVTIRLKEEKEVGNIFNQISQINT
jgi:hypothetical protein